MIRPGDDLSQALARDRLGIRNVLFVVVCAAGPLMYAAGILPVAYATVGNIGLPSAFLVVGIILALFSVGYVTMGRHLPHAGAFYAYIGAGLGRTAGVAAAWVALLAYNALQIGLYGIIGGAASPLVMQAVGLDLPWWVYALAAWALVAVLGVLRVDVNARVLAVLLVIEVGIILVYDGSDMLHSAHGLSLATFSPSELLNPGTGAILAIAFLGFTGFESSVNFAEESRGRRTVPIATYVAVALIAGLYGLSAWAIAMTTGTDKIVAAAAKQGPDLLFNLAGQQLGTPAATGGRILFATSILAAAISFHNAVARYVFALGRERALPAVFARTSATGAPQAGSIVQSALALIVILVYAVAGLDPLVQLFYIGGTSGALGILLLIVVTSVAVLRYFAADPRGESRWHTRVAPGAALVGVSAVLYLVVDNFAGLLGVPDTSPLRWGVPGAFGAVAVAGLIYGNYLRTARPEVFAAIGLGAPSPVSVGLERSPDEASGTTRGRLR